MNKLSTFSKKRKKEAESSDSASRVMLTVAANAENDDQCQNNDPSAVIVKEMAKAIVHSAVLPCRAEGGFDPGVFPPYTTILCKGRRIATFLRQSFQDGASDHREDLGGVF